MLIWLENRRREQQRYGGTGSVNRLRPRALESLESRQMLTISIQFDYTYDTNNFFDTQAKRDLLSQAALALTSRLTDDLSAIQPSGQNTWTPNFIHPGTGASQNIADLVVPADTIIVYAGGRALGGNTIGLGGPGGYGASGFQPWFDTLRSRGEAGALAAPKTDFGPWGGSISFNTTTNWHFGTTTAGISGKSDFLSVAEHELGHLLGFGTADSFKTFISGTSFTGQASVAKYGGNVPLDPGLGHWADNTVYQTLPVAMDPSISNGTRVLFTELDYAGLDDLGWSLTSLNTAPTLNASGAPALAAIVEDVASDNGTLVSAILASGAGGDPITDPDAGALDGIAVTAVVNTNGQWQFSTNSGGNWTAFGSPSTATARLLNSDGVTRIRFVPNANFNGAVNPGITFRAWDRTAGANGGTADTTTNGGSTAFSTATETASITVTPVNDAPTNIALSANSVPENSPNGTVVGNLSTTDIDANETFTYSMVGSAGGRFAVSGNQIVVADGTLLDYETATSHDVTVRVTDSGNASFDKLLTINITDLTETSGQVVGRFVFYNQSVFDGKDAAANSGDDSAIAPDKTPLLPGGTATLANYTNYDRGLNGIMVDILHPTGAPTANDFTFKVGNNNTPSGWALAPAPTSVTVRVGAGLQGSDRVTIVWANRAIIREWLQVTVKTGGATGLNTANVFYFGNAPDEAGNVNGSAVVDANEEILARNNTKTFLNPATITDAYDFNRDGYVNAADQIAARGNVTNGNELIWISVPLSAALSLAPQTASAAPSARPLLAAAVAAALESDDSAAGLTVANAPREGQYVVAAAHAKRLLHLENPMSRRLAVARLMLEQLPDAMASGNELEAALDLLLGRAIA